MKARTILICAAQVPFSHGGAELHVAGLHRELRRRGFEAEVVAVPFKWYPPQRVLTHALIWRLFDLTESNRRRVDMVIGTKFPSYFARHPRKIVWLIHQFRQAYDLHGTEHGMFRDDPAHRLVRERLIRADTAALKEARRIFTNARNTADRLWRYNRLRGEPLYHPPPLAERCTSAPPEDFVLSVGRLDPLKRVDLLLKALPHAPAGVRALIAGRGPQEAELRALATALGVADRVEFLGFVPDDRLVDLYSRALAVYYAPRDEDFGYVTLEALLSERPVVTCSDSGGVLEFVRDGEGGLVRPPEPEAVGEALARLAADPAAAIRLGRAGRPRVAAISWDHVIARLTAD